MLDLKNAKHIHCIGIGGIGLSAIADILVARGYKVTGSDMNQNEITQKLEKKGIKVFYGHEASNINGADIIVFSAAISPENPELKKALEENITCISRAKMLGELMRHYKTSIAVSGTHGKTTTTSMVALVLKAAEKDPTILVGGNLEEIDGNVSVGRSDYFITEACEYVDSFLELAPKIEIILNIDSDHLDYFKDIDHIVKSFNRFAELLPEDGILFAYSANPFVKQVIEGKENVITFGLDEKSDYYAQNIEFDEKGNPGFTVMNNGEKVCDLKLSVPGEHNVINTLATVACCHTLGVDSKIICDTLNSFSGTQRRFDIMGETAGGLRIIDDYAHHPTEIRATLSAARNMKFNKMWCIFQPHTYTRTMALFDEFSNSFEEADVVVMMEIYAAREKNINQMSSKLLVDEIKKKHPEKEVYFFVEFDDIVDYIYKNAEKNDLILTMGAGDVYKVAEKLLEKDGI